MLTEQKSFIDHAELLEFAESKVNLKREDATEFREQVGRLRDKLELHIADHPDFGLKKMLLSGSLAKGTALKTLNDADVAVYVEAGSKPPASEADLLNWLTKKLREAYPQMKPEQIKPVTHCVRISFNGTGLDVDVAPVHYYGKPNDVGYLLSKSGKTVETSIPLHLEFIRTRKERHPQNFAQVVRFVKWWIRQRKEADDAFRFKSFKAEMILAHLSDTGTDFSRYPEALEAFFNYIDRTQLKKRIAFTDYYQASVLPAKTEAAMEIFDPVNATNNVAADYDEADRKRICAAAEDALDAIAEAKYSTTKGRAIECWRRILGTSFGS